MEEMTSGLEMNSQILNFAIKVQCDCCSACSDSVLTRYCCIKLSPKVRMRKRVAPWKSIDHAMGKSTAINTNTEPISKQRMPMWPLALQAPNNNCTGNNIGIPKCKILIERCRIYSKYAGRLVLPVNMWRGSRTTAPGLGMSSTKLHRNGAERTVMR